MRSIIRDNKTSLMVTYGCMLYEGAITALLVATMVMLERHYVATAGQISMLITAKSVGTVVTIYFSGAISDKVGRKNIITIGAVFFMIFLVGMVSTQSFAIAMFLSFVGGVAHGLMDSPSISMLIDIFGAKSGPAMSFVQVFFAGGGAITTFLTSQVMKYNIDWKFLYFGYAVVGILVIILVKTARYPKKNQSEGTIKKVNHNWKPSFLREGLLLAILTFFLSSSNSVLNTWLPTFANVEKNMDLISSMQLLTKLQLGNITGALIFAYVLTKVHATSLLVFNSVVAFVGFLGIIFMGEISALNVFIIGMMMGVLFSLSLNVAGDLFPNDSGKATGFIGSASMSAGMTSVFITGKIYENIGFMNIFKITLGLLFVAVIIAFYFKIVFIKLVRGDNNEEITNNN